VSLFRRTNGTFDAYVWVRGQRFRKATNTKNRRQAELIEKKLKEELNAERHGLSEPEPQIPFTVLAARFLSEGSPKPHHHDRLKLLLPYFGTTQIGRINKNDARQYRAYRHAQRKLTETTVNRDLEVLRHILNWAVDEGLLLSNPLSRLHMERERRKPRPVISTAEEFALLAVCPPHLRKMVKTVLGTGMRRGEVLSQRWEHIDFDRQLLFVTHSKTPEGEAREIPLTNDLFEMLKSEKKSSGIIFTFKDQPIRSIKTAWKTALRKSRIRPLRFHDLRHSFNSRLIEVGVIREVRMALMGHSGGEDVHSRYCQIELPLKREAIRKLEQWMEVQRQQIKTQNQEQKGGTDDATSVERPDQPGDSGQGAAGDQRSDAALP
jgi:integrase